ncbi:DUF4013 domain-containing protein [Halorubrum sp. AD140]|uniref:DUF4013 domain-containing protein n=1 Tax=Halorubrum sp. AD140 TaxID=3050073 RepID=UPI002ACCA6D8|nr:DUF4013 domain-containing protein [Halorubrum sp. AD140]MDZ5812537.1 DUF4013 domain-containing protein [Halorubrum sp. AD140]
MLRGVSTALIRSTDAVGVLVVGGLLTLLTWVAVPAWVAGALAFPPLVALAPLALAPALVVRGYFVRVLAHGGATGNRDGAPSFVAWNELYRDGLKSALLSALLLAPLALAAALVALAGAAVGTGVVELAPVTTPIERTLGPGGGTAVLGIGGAALSAGAAVYLLAFAYVRPAALAAFAASGRLRDGLRPTRVADVAGSAGYATAWVVAAVALGAGYALAAPFVPLVVGVVVVFAGRVAAHALYGRGAAAAVDFGPGAGDETPETAATDSLRASAPDALGPVSATTPPTSTPDRPDGGFRRSTPEVSPSVQTGRTVSVDEGDGGDGGFEWNADVDRGTAGDSARETEGPPTGDDGFEWGAGVGPEDKS